MIKIIFSGLLLVSVSVFADTLTFHQAVSQMLQNNPVLAQRKLASSVAHDQWGQSKAAYYPQIDVLQTWNHSNNPVFVFGSLLNQAQFSQENFAIDALNHPDALNDFSSRFQVGWLVYDFGKRENQVRSARSMHQIATLQEENTRITLLRELVRRYYAVSLARERVDVRRESVMSAQSRLQQATERVSNGMAVLSDKLTAEVFYARELQERIESENQQKLTVSALLQLLGRTDDLDVSTTDLSRSNFADKPLSWWQEHMQKNHSEMKIISESKRMAHSQVQLQRSSFFPSLQAWSNYEWHGDSLSYTGNNYGVGLELKWNLFRGFSDSRQLTAAKAQEKIALEKQREVESVLLLQLKTAYFQFQSAKEKLVVSALAVQQAEENKRIYAERYAGGFVTIQDSLRAETAFNETRLLHSQNLYELYVAYAELLAASGKEEEIKDIGVQS